MNIETADEAVLQAMKALGGERTLDEITRWIEARNPNRWKDLGTTVADLTSPPNKSTQYPPERQFLERVGKGVYRLRSGW